MIELPKAQAEPKAWINLNPKLQVWSCSEVLNNDALDELPPSPDRLECCAVVALLAETRLLKESYVA